MRHCQVQNYHFASREKIVSACTENTKSIVRANARPRPAVSIDTTCALRGKLPSIGAPQKAQIKAHPLTESSGLKGRQRCLGPFTLHALCGNLNAMRHGIVFPPAIHPLKSHTLEVHIRPIEGIPAKRGDWKRGASSHRRWVRPELLWVLTFPVPRKLHLPPFRNRVSYHPLLDGRCSGQAKTPHPWPSTHPQLHSRSLYIKHVSWATEQNSFSLR